MRLCTYFSWIMFAVIRCLKSTINTARQCHKPSQSELDKYQKGIIRHFCCGTIWYIWYSWSWHTETFFAVALFDIFDIFDIDIQKDTIWYYIWYLWNKCNTLLQWLCYYLEHLLFYFLDRITRFVNTCSKLKIKWCFPENICLLKVNNGNIRKRCAICSKLTIKTVFIVNFK